MPTTTELRRAQAECLAAWVCSSDACAAATHLLERRRLPHHATHVDDVLMDTAQRVLGRLHRHGPLEPHAGGGDPVVPYARRTLDHAVTDLLRGPRSREVPLGEHLADDVVDPVSFDPTLLSGELDAIRRRLSGEADAADAWVVAAALVLTSLAEEPALQLRPDTPEPQDGGEAARWRWAGLFYGGRIDCFPNDGEPDDANRRNRRSRAMRAVDRLLAAASGGGGPS